MRNEWPRAFRVSKLLLIVLIGPAIAATAPDVDPIDREVKRFADVFAVVQSYSADKPGTDQAIYQGAIPGLLSKLDPHSVFFDPNQFEQLKQMERSTSKGFGSVVSILPGRVIVLQTLPGTPSARSGISPGDEIVGINNIRLDRLDFDQLIGLLQQAHQRTAQLFVHRPGMDRLLTFTLVPEEMQSRSVERAFLLQPNYGYIKIASFEANTGAQVREAITQLGGNDLKGLVIDLRGNGGGIVNAALETLSLFLDSGQKILAVRGRKTALQEVAVPVGAHPYKFKLAVIVDEKSASASEIVAGALQDHDRATIVGTPSFGKGLVETVFPLSQNTGLALTTALYYTPSGRSIQKPLSNGSFALSQTAAHPNEKAEFKTDSGRPVAGGGGIIPDRVVPPEAQDRLRIALDASGIFVSFATEYTRQNKIDATFEVTPHLLDEFEAYAAEHHIQPSFAEWAAHRNFVTNRLKVEVVNQGLGVDKGDEVEAHYDPQIQAALEAVD